MMATDQKQTVILKSSFVKHTWISVSHIPGNCTKNECFGLLCFKTLQFSEEAFLPETRIYGTWIYVHADCPRSIGDNKEHWAVEVVSQTSLTHSSRAVNRSLTLLISRPEHFCLLSLTLILRSDVQMFSAIWHQTARNCIQINFYSKPTCA